MGSSELSPTETQVGTEVHVPALASMGAVPQSADTGSIAVVETSSCPGHARVQRQH